MSMETIQFYLKHLEERELKLVENILHGLCSFYSPSYLEWREANNPSSYSLKDEKSGSVTD